MSQKTEAQMLREYVQIMKARKAAFIKEMHNLLQVSTISISEAKPFYHALNQFENEHK